ncbi:hypothetical protein IKF20_02640 [Candidatus Saccharibacteria bacterium]|nr:hypothetical protein [Candidatus Saccharibacteria bacterium]
MDLYEEKADSYSQQEEYYECLASCPEGKDCHCGGQTEASPEMWLILIITLLIWPGVLFWGGWVIELFEKIKNRKKGKKK